MFERSCNSRRLRVLGDVPQLPVQMSSRSTKKSRAKDAQIAYRSERKFVDRTHLFLCGAIHVQALKGAALRGHVHGGSSRCFR